MVRKHVLCSLLLVVSLLIAIPMFAASNSKDEETLQNAATVLQAMVSSKDIPHTVLNKADCIVILPNVKKFAVGIGGTGGRGPMSCRQGKNYTGKWSAPAMYSIGGASAGFQIGGTSTDFVLLIMAPTAVDKVLDGKVKVGQDATAAAGPGATTGGGVGGADILSYARAKGLFAGVSLNGATLSPDQDSNKRLYGKEMSARDIVTGTSTKATAGGKSLVSLLDANAAGRK
jgi:lipid-binding SYLF domain-containing protein